MRCYSFLPLSTITAPNQHHSVCVVHTNRDEWWFLPFNTSLEETSSSSPIKVDFSVTLATSSSHLEGHHPSPGGRSWGCVLRVLLYRTCNTRPQGRRRGRRSEKEGHWGADGSFGDSEFPGHMVPLEAPMEVLGHFLSFKLTVFGVFYAEKKVLLQQSQQL